MALIEIHIHVHGDIDLERLENIVSENFEAIQAQLTRIDESTTDIANDIRKLLDQIDTGMSAAEVAEVKSSLTAAADTLEATAHTVE